MRFRSCVLALDALLLNAFALLYRRPGTPFGGALCRASKLGDLSPEATLRSGGHAEASLGNAPTTRGKSPRVLHAREEVLHCSSALLTPLLARIHGCALLSTRVATYLIVLLVLQSILQR